MTNTTSTGKILRTSSGAKWDHRKRDIINPRLAGFIPVFWRFHAAPPNGSQEILDWLLGIGFSSKQLKRLTSLPPSVSTYMSRVWQLLPESHNHLVVESFDLIFNSAPSPSALPDNITETDIGRSAYLCVSYLIAIADPQPIDVNILTFLDKVNHQDAMSSGLIEEYCHFQDVVHEALTRLPDFQHYTADRKLLIQALEALLAELMAVIFPTFHGHPVMRKIPVTPEVSHDQEEACEGQAYAYQLPPGIPPGSPASGDEGRGRRGG